MANDRQQMGARLAGALARDVKGRTQPIDRRSMGYRLGSGMMPPPWATGPDGTGNMVPRTEVPTRDMPPYDKAPEATTQPVAYAGGNPYFDERTGQFTGPQAYKNFDLDKALANMRLGAQPQEMQRLSPGVYRGANGSLVDSTGRMLPNQPQRQPMPPQFRNNTNGQYPTNVGQQIGSGINPQYPSNVAQQIANGAMTPIPGQYGNPVMSDPTQAAMQAAQQYGMYQPPPRDVYIGKGMTMPIPQRPVMYGPK